MNRRGLLGGCGFSLVFCTTEFGKIPKLATGCCQFIETSFSNQDLIVAKYRYPIYFCSGNQFSNPAETSLLHFIAG